MKKGSQIERIENRKEAQAQIFTPRDKEGEEVY